MYDIREAALGHIPSDLVISGCSLVSVYTGEIIPDTQIAIYDSRISYVGTDASHTVGPDTKTLDVRGRYVSPGLADPHTHIDQFVLPSQTAAHMLKRGTTALFSDPIDITGVAGYDGFCWFAEACQDVPVRIFHGVPGGLPVDPTFSHLYGLDATQRDSLLCDPMIYGMGEVFSWTKVINGDARTLQDVAATLDAGLKVNGHTAGMSDHKLAAYAATGISSCHEPIDYEQVIERLRAGLYVMVRDGSIRRDLRHIMERVVAEGISTHRLMLCSDGLNPTDLLSGHMDHCVREAIQAGICPVEAISMASRNVFEYYGMDRDMGGVAPGRLADLVILDDLESFQVNQTMVGGREASGSGAETVPAWLTQTVRLCDVSPSDFVVAASGDCVVANTICLRTEIITEQGEATLPVCDGVVAASDMIWKVAAFDRIHQTKNHTVGFLEGFGDGDGALASTASFHENDLVVLGSNDKDMAAAANHTIHMKGGMAAAKDGHIVASLPMPVAGLMSTLDVEQTAERFISINRAVQNMGCRLASPHLVTLFLPFLALPHIRILNCGMVNVRRQEIIPPIQNIP